MPEINYTEGPDRFEVGIDLACQVLGVEPESLLAKREYEDHVVLINAAGQKFKFSFEYLEDYKQYLEANSGDPERSPRDGDNKSKVRPKTNKKPAARSRSSAARKKTAKTRSRPSSTE